MANQTKTLNIGQSATALDIYLTANGAAVSGQYVGFELFDSTNSSVVSGVSLNPSLGTYTGSGIIPVAPLGDWRIDWTIVTLANNLASISESFCVQDTTITIGFNPPEDKTSQIYEAVRLDIGDPDGNFFDDSFMARILTKAVRRLNQRLGLSSVSRPKGIPGGFGGPRIKVQSIVANTELGTITPDNDEICDLVVLQMELIILESEVSALKRLGASTSGPFSSTVASSAKDGVSVTNADGVSVSISPSRLSFRSDLYKFDVKNRREELEMAIRAFLNRMTGNFGKLIY